MKTILAFQLLTVLLLLPAGCEASDAPHDHSGHEEQGRHDDHHDHEGHSDEGGSANEGKDPKGHEGHGHDAHADEDDSDHDAHDSEPAHDHKGHHDGHAPGIVELRSEAAARVRIRTAVAEKRSFHAVHTTTGRVDFNQDRLAQVRPRIPGRVHKVDAHLGQQVQAGDVLLVIDSIELGAAKSAYLQAKAQLGLTEETLKRERGLLSDKITTEQAVIEARAANQQALAAFQSARERLRLLGLSDDDIASVRYNDPAAPLFSLRTPIDGTVVEKKASLGEMLTPDRSPYAIADLKTLWIWVDVYERDLARVHLEDTVEVTVPAYPERTFEGTVTYIQSAIDPDTRTARARITVENAHAQLKPGMFASVTVTDPHVGDAPAVGVVIPASAVQRDGNEPIAFVQTAARRYERRELTIGQRTDHLVHVLHGISQGESVVIEGTFILKSEAAKESMGGGHSH